MGALKITNDNFQSEIIDGKGVSLVDFGATWCGPCQQLAPIVDDLAKDFDGNDSVRIAKCDVDEAQDLAAKFGVMSVPTILFFKDGEQVESMLGVQSKATLEGKVKALLG